MTLDSSDILYFYHHFLDIRRYKLRIPKSFNVVYSDFIRSEKKIFIFLYNSKIEQYSISETNIDINFKGEILNITYRGKTTLHPFFTLTIDIKNNNAIIKEYSENNFIEYPIEFQTILRKIKIKSLINESNN